MLVQILSIFSAASFLYYGIFCLYSKRMAQEFERFGLSPLQRNLTGILQLLGSAGLFIGLLQPLVGLIASSGLALLMFLGFLTRLKIRDTIIQSLPALLFMILNTYLAIAYYEYLNILLDR